MAGAVCKMCDGTSNDHQVFQVNELRHGACSSCIREAYCAKMLQSGLPFREQALWKTTHDLFLMGSGGLFRPIDLDDAAMNFSPSGVKNSINGLA